MTYQDLGYNNKLAQYKNEQELDSFEIGRVILEHKERYVVKTPTQEYDAELIGNLRFTAESRYHLPAVGDWVAISEYDRDKVLIHSVYPRYSVIERQAVSKSAEIQIIATNIDYGLILLSVDRDFNINRLERYITICNNSNVEPIIVLTKIDLVNESTLNIFLNEIKERVNGLSIIAISNLHQIGLDKIKALVKRGKTYCLLGSSGVGKSTLLNLLVGKTIMNTAAINKSIERGKHITTHRELVVLEDGGILIDNPGMREIGIPNTTVGLEITFNEIIVLSQGCKFKNCSHTNEKDCAIQKAIEEGNIDLDSYTNFLKMEKERAFFESSLEENKKKNKKLRKTIKSNHQERKKNKY